MFKKNKSIPQYHNKEQGNDRITLNSYLEIIVNILTQLDKQYDANKSQMRHTYSNESNYDESSSSYQTYNSSEDGKKHNDPSIIILNTNKEYEELNLENKYSQNFTNSNVNNEKNHKLEINVKFDYMGCNDLKDFLDLLQNIILNEKNEDEEINNIFGKIYDNFSKYYRDTYFFIEFTNMLLKKLSLLQQEIDETSLNKLKVGPKTLNEILNSKDKKVAYASHLFFSKNIGIDKKNSVEEINNIIYRDNFLNEKKLDISYSNILLEEQDVAYSYLTTSQSFIFKNLNNNLNFNNAFEYLKSIFQETEERFKNNENNFKTLSLNCSLITSDNFFFLYHLGQTRTLKVIWNKKTNEVMIKRLTYDYKYPTEFEKMFDNFFQEENDRSLTNVIKTINDYNIITYPDIIYDEIFNEDFLKKEPESKIIFYVTVNNELFTPNNGNIINENFLENLFKNYLAQPQIKISNKSREAIESELVNLIRKAAIYYLNKGDISITAKSIDINSQNNIQAIWGVVESNLPNYELVGHIDRAYSNHLNVKKFVNYLEENLEKRRAENILSIFNMNINMQDESSYSQNQNIIDPANIAYNIINHPVFRKFTRKLNGKSFSKREFEDTNLVKKALIGIFLTASVTLFTSIIEYANTVYDKYKNKEDKNFEIVILSVYSTMLISLLTASVILKYKISGEEEKTKKGRSMERDNSLNARKSEYELKEEIYTNIDKRDNNIGKML